MAASTSKGGENSIFQEGAITRIKVENIQTYDSVEFRPGPHLNVLIGPNGTGKSTIICAICLGLNGKPSLVNKSSVTSVVKHGKKQGIIELELYNPDGDNWVIRRTIDKAEGHNQSTWHINSRQATQKSVSELIARLNIQVDNLCQFLPQEKVGEFPNMSPQQLLESTQKAAGPPGMYENHVKLKDERQTSRRLQTEYDTTEQLLEQEVQKNARLEQDVENFEKRKEHRERIEILKKKRPWLEYESKRKEFEEVRKRKKEKEEAVKEQKKLHAPLQKKLDAAKGKVLQFSEQASKATSKLRENANTVADKSKSIESESDKMSEIEERFSQKRDEEARRQAKVNDLKRLLEAVEDELNNLDDSQDVQPKIDRVVQETRRINTEMTRLSQQGERLKIEINADRRKITDLQNELRSVQNVSKRRLETLRHFNRHSYEAVQWLRANHSQFKSRIYEPLMLVLNVRDPQHARYLENTISSNDMVAFVCEDPEDREKFMRQVRDQQQLKINAIDMPNRPSAQFKPDKPIEHYRRYGFYSYLRDMIECPEGVLRYLCLQYKIHNIPVGDGQTRDKVQEIRDKEPSLKMFYTANHQYVFRRSRYNPEDVSSRSTELRDPRYLKDNIDTSRLRSLNDELQNAQRQVQAREQDHQNKTASYNDLNDQLNQLRNEKKELQTRKNARQALEQQIKTKRDRIAQTEAQRIDLDAEEARVKAEIRKINLSKARLLEQLQEHTRLCVKHSKDKVVTVLKQNVALQKVIGIESDIRESTNALHQAEREYEQMKERAKDMVNVAKQLLQEAKRATGTSDSDSLPDQLRQAFEQCPNTLEEIDAAIHEEQARADLTLDVDESTIREYQERKKLIERLQREKATKREALEKHRTEMADIRANWLEPLQNLVGSVNTAFGQFFRRMNCAGEVDLSVPENEEDYEKYGIRIKVKFRDNEPLSELTSARQSGGERSVSTILYVMALQELTRCPFRCVDEINQGMDPVNERKIFDLVVKTACQDNSSQYFLLTPKLLPNLGYSEKMTVHCVFNGPHSISHKDWNIRKFLHRRRAIVC